jgi:DNA-binding MarR family transcriptional regulator
MRSEGEHTNLGGETYRELRLLEEVSRSSEVSQRRLAGTLGIALGVTNVLLKTLARKGYIRIIQVKWRRWIYVLTPTGIAHKVQLTVAYVDGFMNHYRRIRDIIVKDLESLALDADSRIAIYGQTELAELAFLVLRNMGVTHIDIVDKSNEDSIFLGLPVKPLESISKEGYAKVLVAFQYDGESRQHELLSAGARADSIVLLLQDNESEPAQADEPVPIE